MVETNDNALIFSFPHVRENAVLRVDFRSVAAPNTVVCIELPAVNGGFQLAPAGQVMMSLCPSIVIGRSGVRYPFAVILSVDGKNAITGEARNTSLDRNPQNYFITPPQGGIDGYWRARKVHPFRVSGSASDRMRLEICVFPMKSKALTYFEKQLQVIPGWGPSAFRGATVMHGGERQCEPVYEDICSLGDWDQTQREKACVWLCGER